MNEPVWLAVGAAVIAISVVLVLRARRRVSDQRISQWASSHGVTLSPDDRRRALTGPMSTSSHRCRSRWITSGSSRWSATCWAPYWPSSPGRGHGEPCAAPHSRRAA